MIPYATPSVPDRWLGGVGNWSTGAWSAGIPNNTSAVAIGNANDNVTLDVVASVASLTLGTASTATTSVLTDNGTQQSLLISGALRIVTGGVLDLSGASTLTVAGTSNNLGTLDLSNSTVANLTGALSNGAILNIDSSSLSTSGLHNSATGIVTATGATLTLGGLNSAGSLAFTSSAISAQGTLNNSGTMSLVDSASGRSSLTQTGSISSIGQAVVRGSTVQTSGGFSNWSQLSLQASTYGNGATTLNAVGNFSNATGATLSISGGSSVSTNYLLNSGTITADTGSTVNAVKEIANSGTMTFLDTSNVTINGKLHNQLGGSFSLAGTPGTSYTFGAELNQGDMVIAAGNTLNIVGGGVFNTYGYNQHDGFTQLDGTLIDTHGVVAVAGGMLLGNGGTITGTVNSSGIISLGNSSNTPGILTINGAYTQRRSPVTGTLDLNIDGTGAGQFGQLEVNGAAYLYGTLNVSLDNGYLPNIGDQFVFLTGTGGVFGTFATLNGMNIGNGEQFAISYGLNAVILKVVPAGMMTEPAAPGSSPVPEPTTLLMVSSAGSLLGLAMRRRTTGH